MLKPIYDYYMWLRVEVTVKEYVNVIANGRQCEQTEVAAVNHAFNSTLSLNARSSHEFYRRI